jgi:hypothetical protein
MTIQGNQRSLASRMRAHETVRGAAYGAVDVPGP